MENKNWWESKTIWAALVAALAGLLSIFGKQIDPAFQNQIVDFILNGITVVGGVFAAVFRAKATTTIGNS